MRSNFPTADELFAGIRSGNRVMLGRAITLVESTRSDDRKEAAELLKRCQPFSGNSFRIGLTGVPGVGKSTFIDSFGEYLVAQGHKVAVLAVDPTSAATQGSILGDKTRMERLSRNEQAFIRPSPSGLTLGGVTRNTREVMLLCEAAGYDRILVETVGVGQSETAVASMVDFFLLLMLPGAGDELQGMKRGIMEMADGILINKADGDQLSLARSAAAGYSSAIRMFPPRVSGWNTRVLLVSALLGTGIDAVYALLDEFRLLAEQSGEFHARRKAQRVEWLHDTFYWMIRDLSHSEGEFSGLMSRAEEAVEKDEIPPTLAASELFEGFIRLLRERKI